MNEVPWRRILEQADGRAPFDHGPDERSRERPEADWSSLEAELRRATQRNVQPHGRAAIRAPEQRQPSPGQHATRLKQQMQTAQAKPSPAANSESRNAGMKNLIAISLSISVVGFAGYKINQNWPHSGAPQATASLNMPLPAKPDGDDGESSGLAGVNVSDGGLDLRPSLAAQSEWAGENLSVQASPDLPALASASSAPALVSPRQNAAAEDSLDETAILDRGRGILERGHVAGARLIFEYLADRGSALGAFALAQTYDAGYLGSQGLPGDRADKAMAAKWYERAAELGGSNSVAAAE